ncbi:MAG: glycosyl hydrolase 108 family protein [Hyphomicrobiales bacterium]
MITVNFGPDRIKVAPITQDAWQALSSVLAAHSYDIRTTDTDSYNCRAITGGTGRSLHSFGIALDINWTTNPFIKTPDKRKVRFSDQPTQAERAQDVKRHLADTDMTEAMIVDVLAIKTSGGKGVFEWGGYWSNVKDAMHFEIDLSPADVAVGIDWDTVKMADLPDGDTVKHDDSINEEARPAMTPSAAFEAVHPFIAKWEGGFVNHPQDPGGATNFGITIDTLSRWRGMKASVADVRNMSVEEARQIFYANYWMPLRADEMPLSVALMTYNAGVNSGPSRGAKLLQRALNDHGQNLEVDGRIGARTVAAIYKVDERRLVDSFAGAHEIFIVVSVVLERLEKVG